MGLDNPVNDSDGISKPEICIGVNPKERRDVLNKDVGVMVFSHKKIKVINIDILLDLWLLSFFIDGLKSNHIGWHGGHFNNVTIRIHHSKATI